MALTLLLGILTIVGRLWLVVPPLIPELAHAGGSTALASVMPGIAGAA